MKTIEKNRPAVHSRRGGALVMTAIAITGMSVLALGMVAVQLSAAVEQHRAQQEQRAALAAEAGLADAFVDLQHDGDGNLGSLNQPLDLAGGKVLVESQSFGPAGRLMRVMSTAGVGDARARAELILHDNVDTLFVWGAFGEAGLSLSSQAKVDSYDSTQGSYAFQVMNGTGSNSWANDEGSVGSNYDVVVGGNALVFGDATCGQSSTTTVLGQGEVSGSTAAALQAVVFPPIVVPVIPSTGNRTFSINTTLASGQHHMGMTQVRAGVTVMVTGPATLVFDSFEMKSNSNFRIDSTNGPVDIFVLDDFIMRGNTLLASNDLDPCDLRINLLSDNIVDPNALVDLDDVGFRSNAKLYGTLYAPDARISIESNFELFGSVIAEQVSLGSNARVHFDEALTRMLPPGVARYTRITWRVMH